MSLPNRPNKTTTDKLSSNTKGTSSKEKQLFYSLTTDALFVEDDSTKMNNKGNRRNFVVLNDFEVAKLKIKIWIINKLTIADKIHATDSWRVFWGKKFTAGLNDGPGVKNIGKVIGEEYIMGEELKDAANNQIALYRIDYDSIKGIHYNIKITSTDERYYLPIILPKAHLIKLHVNKTEEESQAIQYSLLLTASYLKANSHKPQPMPLSIARLFLNAFENSEDRDYFQTCGGDLRLLIKAAATSIIKNDGAELSASKGSQYFIQATKDLFTYWSKEATKYLDSLRQSKPGVPFEGNYSCLDVLVDELIYITNEEVSQSSRDIVLKMFSEYFNLYLKSEFEFIIKLAVEHGKLGDYQIYANRIRQFMNLSPVTPPPEEDKNDTVDEKSFVAATPENTTPYSRRQ